MPADLAIRNARVIDGSGGPSFTSDVEVKDGRITRVGQAESAAREIDAAGHVLSPGFIDTHSHDDGAFLRYPGMEFKVAQGVTSEVSGNCGSSTIPNEPGRKFIAGDLASSKSSPWTDLDGYFAVCMEKKPAINNMMLVGHNRVRAFVVGLEKRTATASELREMRGHVAKAMEQGACGFSTGLIYEPGRYSDTHEVVSLAQECTPYGGIYATHMRNEGDKLLEAVEEALTIARSADVGLHISHHKAAGKRNWGRVRESFARLDRAADEGISVTLDIYPYTAGSGPMWQYVNLERIDVEWAANVMLNSCPDDTSLEGKMIPEIAREKGWDVAETVRQVLGSPRGTSVICTHFIIDEADIETNLRDRRVMIGSDGIPDLNGRPHPRLFGTMPRVLAKYVRDRRILSLEEAIRRMTSLPAERFGMIGRGLIREGYHADLVLFDPDTIQDTATYEDPKQEPVGIGLVVVNGQIAVEDGRHTAVGSGRMLRYRRDS
jgi:N-acyl-D-amino-acid deacylase